MIWHSLSLCHVYNRPQKYTFFSPHSGSFPIQIITQVINHNLGNKMLGQAGPNSITQVMIYNQGRHSVLESACPTSGQTQIILFSKII